MGTTLVGSTLAETTLVGIMSVGTAFVEIPVNYKNDELAKYAFYGKILSDTIRYPSLPV